MEAGTVEQLLSWEPKLQQGRAEGTSDLAVGRSSGESLLSVLAFVTQL